MAHSSAYMPANMAAMYAAYVKKPYVAPQRALYDTSSGICPECRKGKLVENYREGDVLCNHCGLVVQSHLIDERPEWNMYASKDGHCDDQAKVRVGAATQASGRLAGTSITGGVGAGRLSRAQNGIDKRTQKDKSIDREVRDMKAVLFCQSLHFPEAVVERAEDIYRGVRAASDHLRDVLPVQAACAYFVDQANFPLALIEREFHTQVTKADLNHVRQYLESNARLKDLLCKDLDVFRNIANLAFKVIDFSGTTVTKWNIIRACEKLKAILRDTVLSSKQPRTIDAAIVSFVCEQNRLEVPDVVFDFYASKETIKKHKQTIKNILDEMSALAKQTEAEKEDERPNQPLPNQLKRPRQ